VIDSIVPGQGGLTHSGSTWLALTNLLSP
jgi:hypothetical protein